MRTSVDILIINNCPSFYKINLYNELARYCKIHVIFIALSNQVTINDSFRKDILFSYDLLSSIQIEKRNKWRSVFRLMLICNQYHYKKIIFGGYADIEEMVLMWFTPKRKNCIQFESSIRESKIKGIYALLKEIIVSRFSVALPSGKLQNDVLESLGFKGISIKTNGVGIFNKQPFVRETPLTPSHELKYLFVGRLINVKNLEFLIHVFNQTDKRLTIIGKGALESELKKLANQNITFIGHISNNEMMNFYLSHDVLILPSLSETWGLVIEEAIYFGIPVLVSEAVGCLEEMVLKPNTGIVFSPHNENDLLHAMEKLENNFDTYKQNCLNFNFEDRDSEQINAYLKILSL